MEEKKRDTPLPSPEESQEVVSEQAVQVQEILQLLGHTISALKLFPSDHATVKKFAGEFWERLKKYLDENWKLEIGIEENAFTLEGQVVYQETQPMKSLPFLFFKDGMQMLFFYKDLDREELQVFLETIRKDAQLPPEESDIVLSLWEKDFANIRYLAPDDYLESKIGAGKGKISPDVDKSRLRTGRIELTAEDKADLEKSNPSDAFPIGGPRALQPETMSAPQETEDDSTETGALDAKELAEIETMLQLNRKISTEEEFVNVVLEILYLEERPEQFTALLEVLGKHHQGLVQKGDFASDYLLLNQIQDLKGIFSPDNGKARQLEKFLKNSCDENAVRALKKALLKGQVSDYSLFFEYLNFYGWTAVTLVAELFEKREDQIFRERAVEYLAVKGQEHLHALTALAQDSKPALTKTIISILGRVDDKKILPHLAQFTNSKSSAIKAEAIRVLGKFADETANKILLGFFADADPQTRQAAVSNLQFLGDKDRATIQSLLQSLRRKDFSKKKREEKKAILCFLVKSQNPDDIRILANSLGKAGIFMSASQVETRLCAVEALERANTSQARESLKSLAKARNKKVRQAAEAALHKLSTSPPQRQAEENKE
jgi:hypothetical protein